MKKEDELAMWNLMKATHENFDCPIRTDEVAEYLDMPEKRACYLVDKWANQGLVDYGVSLRTVWMTAKGEVTTFDEYGYRVKP